MFTGIVQGIAIVANITEQAGLTRYDIQFPTQRLEQLKIGASIAIEGTCLTVVAIQNEIVSFDAIAETLQKTTLGELRVNDKVNFERAACFGDEIGGHMLSGHVYGKGIIRAIDTPENNYELTIELPEQWINYVFPKGYIALCGCSLTVVDVDKKQRTFSVHIIPETLAVTTLSDKRVGGEINFEIDAQTQAIVDSVNYYLSTQTD